MCSRQVRELFMHRESPTHSVLHPLHRTIRYKSEPGGSQQDANGYGPSRAVASRHTSATQFHAPGVHVAAGGSFALRARCVSLSWMEYRRWVNHVTASPRDRKLAAARSIALGVLAIAVSTRGPSCTGGRVGLSSTTTYPYRLLRVRGFGANEGWRGDRQFASVRARRFRTQSTWRLSRGLPMLEQRGNWGTDK
jgi:hypothetical protein